MSNYEQLRNIRRYRRNRRRAESVGMALVGIGFCMAVCVSGDYCTLPFRYIMLVAFCGCGVMGLGTLIVNFIDKLNKEHPLVYRPVETGDDLWYTMYRNEMKRRALK